jgi:putative peptidoglycan lipid II flippase
MVRRLFETLHREVRGLHEAAYLLGFFALCSQLLALVRDRLLAGTFGAGSELDLYYAAFRYPDLIFVGIASMVSIYVLIPFLSERAEDRGAERAFLNSVFTVFSLAIVSVSVLAYVFTPRLLTLSFPGLMSGTHGETLTLMTRLLLLQPILLGLSNLLGSITQSRERFRLYAVSPLLYNAGIMGGILFLYPLYGLPGLSLGVVFGALLHLAIQFPFVAGEGLLPRVTTKIDFRSVRRVVLLSLPRTLALSAHQLALLVIAGFASLLTPGSIAVLNLAYNLQAVPLTIVGVSYSVAAFPTLARFFSGGKHQEFLEQVIAATRHILFWSLPALALIIVLRAQIVRVILGAGAFGWTETRLTAAALALFAISLAAQSLSLLFVRGYYASGNTKKPLFVNLLSAMLVVVLALFLTSLFTHTPAFRDTVEALLRVSDIPGTEVLMLPFAYSLAALLNAGLLWFLFQRDFSSFFSRVGRTFRHSALAALLMGGVAYFMLDVLDEVFNLDTFWGILLQGLGAGLTALFSGVMLLSLLKSEELAEAMRALRHKFWKTPVIQPEAEQIE